jgi:hypothetical protein
MLALSANPIADAIFPSRETAFTQLLKSAFALIDSRSVSAIEFSPSGKYLVVHAAIVMGFSPTFIGVKHNGVPLAFKAIHLWDSTGKARVSVF